MAYAGRLDPMAEGELLVLTADDTKKREYYQKLGKGYEFKALLGIETDTYDLLGLAGDEYTAPTDNEIKMAKCFIDKLPGRRQQKYPPYSAKAVGGKKLFLWAREGRLSEIEIPTQVVKIYTSCWMGYEAIERERMEAEIAQRIKFVKGDFRQEEILQRWKGFFRKNKARNFYLIKANITCSSGTYVRGLVQELGLNIGSGATTFSIKRTAVGLDG